MTRKFETLIRFNSDHADETAFLPKMLQLKSKFHAMGKKIATQYFRREFSDKYSHSPAVIYSGMFINETKSRNIMFQI